MKRIIAMLLAALMLLSMAACGSVEEETPEVYVPSEDIEVAVAFIDNGTAKVVTRKTSDKELKSIDLACVYYNGNGTGSSERIQCDFSSEGTLSIWTFTAQTGSIYMDAIIASVTFADGTVHTCPGVDSWVSLAKLGYSEEDHNKKMEALATTEAAAAEKCDAVELKPGTPAEGKLELGVKNNSGKEINEVVAYLLWFDAEGKPIDKKGVLVANAEKISAKTLAVDEDASYTATAPENAASVKAVVQSVTFTDETVWENIYVYEWAVVNCGAAE